MHASRFGHTVAAAILLCGALCSFASRAAKAEEPPREDPTAMQEIAVPSGGDRVPVELYPAAGLAPHGVALLLHGYPGNGGHDAGLAEAVRRAGFDALFVEYRGSSGSGGTFSFAHALDDVAAVLAWVRMPENAARYGFDDRRIALVGHSFGGWLALVEAAREPASVCVAALAAWNVGWAARRFPAHDDERAASLEDFRRSTEAEGGPIHASADDLQREIVEHADSWDVLAQASALKDRPLLLVGAARDTPDEDIEMQERLELAIRAAGGTSVHLATLDDDHPFSAHRRELATLLAGWLRVDCGRGRPAP